MKYPALLTISTIFKILAWIVGILGIIGSILWAIWLGEEESGGVGVIYFIFGILFTAFECLILYAAAEGIKVMLAIEENTREAADSIKIRNIRES